MQVFSKQNRYKKSLPKRKADQQEEVDEAAVVNLNRCIGCGLCVTTCETEAIQLVKKPDDHQYLPPKSGAETYMRIAQERGKNVMPKG